MDVYERGFLRYLKLKEIQTNRQIIQFGGGKETVKVGKHKLMYDITSYGDGTIDLLVLAKKKANDKQPCFIMTITPGDSSQLLSISRGIKCFEDDHDNSSDIVLAALEIAKLKGAKTFEFTDNSTKTVNGKKLRLADLSFLTTGKTWYERILPIKPSNKDEAIDIEIRRRKKALSNTWYSVYNNLMKEGIDIDIDITDINIYEIGSAMEVLKRAKEQKKYHKSLFNNPNMFKLLDASNIQTLHGVHWIMDIK